MKQLILISLLFTTASLFAADGEYAVSKINPVLLKKADAVLRYENISFEIISTKEAIETNHYVITVLNENGSHWAEFVEYYDKLREISSVEAFLYDEHGRQLKKIKTKDLRDMSAQTENLMDDNRLKVHNFYHGSYPYTIEYRVEVRYKNTLFFPAWSPQGGEKLAVEHSEANIICPSDYQFRYKAFNYPKEPAVRTERNKRIANWTVRDMPAIVRYPYSPLWHELTTYVIFGPTEFQIDEYKGNMSTWQDFGKFVYSLKYGRDVLPENVKRAVQQLAAGTTDQREKVRILYEYMQKNTRYISVQLGIGGWQPFEAAYVASKGYGDCKALTNYMYSILKEAGIPSFYSVVRAGGSSNYITEDFPSQQFNHVILCVPMAKDTMWLECTSQTNPAGYLGSFTGNRKALVVTESGGKLVSTPRYGLSENLQARNITGKIDGEGTLQFRAETLYGGTQQDKLSSLVNALSREKVQEVLQEELQLSTYSVNNFKYDETKAVMPELKEHLDVTVSNFATVTGKRLFVTPNVLNRSTAKLTVDEERKVDFVLQTEWRDEDKVELEIPAGYELEASMPEVAIRNKYGSYSVSAKVEGNKIIYKRVREQYSGRFPASEQAALVKFFADIFKADRNKIVLVRKEA